MKGGSEAARLLFRVDPHPLESPRGYLCRVAQANSYQSPLSLVQLAKLRVADLERRGGVQRIAHLLRLTPGEWASMCYRHIKGPGQFEERLFYGCAVRADQFNYGRPRVCPQCLKEEPVWWAVWDLGLVAACPRHGCLLVSRCPACGRRFAWRRRAVDECRCGTGLGKIASEVAPPDVVAMSALIYHAAGFPPNAAADHELTTYGFPPQIFKLPLGRLLWLVRSIGLISDQDRLRRKQRAFARTELNVAIQACQATIAMLRDWPQSFREALKRMIPEETAQPAALNFADVFGNFYRHLFRVLPRREFGFLHEAFEQFVVEDCNTPVRQRRYFTAAARGNTRWICADQAEKIAHVISTRISDLVHEGQIQGMFFDGRGRTECWVNRELLDRWIRVRDAEMALYMKRPEAVQLLGLKNITVMSVARAGLIRYVQGADHYFPSGFHFLREDVLKITDAFRRHPAPLRRYSKPGEVIALRHALKNFLGRDHGLPAVIRAVLDGSLAPVAYTNRFREISGYIFRTEDLRKYRPAPGMAAAPEGAVNYGEAARLLGVAVPVIRGLVIQGIFRPAANQRNGFSKLLSVREVREFAERYIATSILAKRCRLHSGSLALYMRNSVAALLAIPLSDNGKGRAFFLPKDVAAQIEIPSPKILREAAQERVVVARKQRWADYRRAKETS